MFHSLPKRDPSACWMKRARFLRDHRRIREWIVDHPEAELAETQFGFVEGKSTCDALMTVVSSAREAIDGGRFMVAVGLDIANAFNSLPWPIINGALAKRNLPAYLRRIVASYLHERVILCPTSSGWRELPVSAGVLQGSVLGPYLWNLSFDRVPRTEKIDECSIVCYADDTLILACADDPWTAATRTSLQVRLILQVIKELGL